ncbi:hypothetical protein ABVF14_005117, partial [Escherichia coli]
FQQKAEKTKNGIVADVNARQKMFSKRLEIQLQIDELRAKLAGTRDAKKREDLRKKLESLELQKKSLR